MFEFGNLVPNIPVPPYDRVLHVRRETCFSFAHRFHGIRQLMEANEKSGSLTSPEFEDESSKIKWYVEVYYSARNNSFSRFLRGKFDQSLTALAEVNCETFAVIDGNGRQLESLVFSQTLNKENISNHKNGMVYRTPKFVDSSALRENDTVLVAATIYYKSNTLAASIT